ncbi:transposase [Nostoc sp. NIES-4103]|nr:transposase [Nostoc sp. NIES-4103]
MSKAYSSNLTKDQWELLEPLIPVAKKGGCPTVVDFWEESNASESEMAELGELGRLGRLGKRNKLSVFIIF